ncbi:uncharacterized protein LOC126830157 [Patella vulgata]|uniref:uncharacterized protein LOC126830157 n=1 Tax=Patella vulgata TaxID=6465 RepID=UPI00218081D5|nr:uncharacterized protein LOC126830157 [Patella vulgata]
MATRSPRRARQPLREYLIDTGDLPNQWRPITPTVTPDESIIRQRGRKSKSTTATRTSPRKSPRKSVTTDLTQLDDSVSSPAVEKDTDTPGRTNSALRGVRKRLVLYQEDTSEDTDFLISYGSPAKKKKDIKKNQVCELTDKLKALSQQQIIDVVLKIVGGDNQLKQEVLNSLPRPDVTPLIKNLEYLQRNIYKSLPNSRFGSGRDAFCYRRVKTHVMSFKTACVGQGKQLAEANSWNTALDYIEKAWEEVGNLPDWDDASHCKTKDSCYRSLAALTKQAIKACSLQKQEVEEFKEWLLEVSVERVEMKPCIAMVDKKISSFK